MGQLGSRKCALSMLFGESMLLTNDSKQHFGFKLNRRAGSSPSWHRLPDFSYLDLYIQSFMFPAKRPLPLLSQISMRCWNVSTIFRSSLPSPKQEINYRRLCYRQRIFFSSLSSPERTNNKIAGENAFHDTWEYTTPRNQPSLRPSPIFSIQNALFEDEASRETRLIKVNWAKDQESSSDASQDFSDLFNVKAFGLTKGSPLQNIISRLRCIRSIINEKLLTRNDGLRFVAAFPTFVEALTSCQTKCTYKLVLRTFNAALSRLRRLHIPICSNIIVKGIVSAMRAKSLAALRYYFNLFLSRSRELDSHESRDILRNLRRWIASVPIAHQDLHINQELWRILTGITDNDHATYGRVRQPCLYEFMKKDDLETWSDYISIIARLGDGDAIWKEWHRIKAESPFMLIGKNIDMMQRAENELARAIVDRFARSLLKAKQPKRAWQLVQDFGFDSQMLSNPTWSELFDYPQYIDKWEPGMSELILRIYEKHVETIERDMGIRWSGGEDGCHLLSERETVEDFEMAEENQLFSRFLNAKDS